MGLDKVIEAVIAIKIIAWEKDIYAPRWRRYIDDRRWFWEIKCSPVAIPIHMPFLLVAAFVMFFRTVIFGKGGHHVYTADH